MVIPRVRRWVMISVTVFAEVKCAFTTWTCPSALWMKDLDESPDIFDRLTLRSCMPCAQLWTGTPSQPRRPPRKCAGRWRAGLHRYPWAHRLPLGASSFPVGCGAVWAAGRTGTVPETSAPDRLASAWSSGTTAPPESERWNFGSPSRWRKLDCGRPARASRQPTRHHSARSGRVVRSPRSRVDHSAADSRWGRGAVRQPLPSLPVQGGDRSGTSSLPTWRTCTAATARCRKACWTPSRGFG